MKERLDIRPEVSEALAAKHPVVALESTVISHGLPYPDNIETAGRMEAAVRASGAIPATVGLLDGRIIVGLAKNEIERLAESKDVVKVSRRDIAPVLAQRRLGATTVAATMLVSAAARIRLFATGGIGGAHRGAQSTLDISADLAELARTPVAVVCAGPKAVLDIGLTREILETSGVPVIGYRTTELPAFYSVSSGFPVDYTASSCKELAEILSTHWALNLPAGILIANPPPAEFALDRCEVEGWIARALEAADSAGVKGKAVTPFLLSFLARESGGRTLTVNKALLISNAGLAGSVAAACVE
jgi:pseudouridine-5'-phosphate glycosidase